MRLPQPGEPFAEFYVVESLLGEGGFASVYRASDTRSDRAVAIKILTPQNESYDVTRAARFLRELRAIASLHDPHIIQLYDFGRTDSGLLYMVVELLGGDDLTEFLDGQMPEENVVTVLVQALSALRAAHQIGILHRDIKPSNIRVLHKPAGHPYIKVLDFGLAKALTGESALTAKGQVVGTPRYMAPELLVGGDASPASDIYALGLVALEMLLGTEHSGIGTGRRLGIPPGAPVGRELAGIVNRMVAPTIADRYRVANDVINDLSQRQGAHQLSAQPVPSTQRSRDIEDVLLSRERGEPTNKSAETALYAAAVAVVLLGLLFGVWRIFGPRTTPPPEPEVAASPTLAELEPEAPAEPEPEAAPPGPCDVARDSGWSKVSYREGLTENRYKVFVPEAEPGARMPMLIVIHNGVWKRSNEKFDIEKTAAQEGFVLGTVHVKDGFERRVVETIDGATSDLCVDPNRVFALAIGKIPDKLREVCRTKLAGIATINHRLPPARCPVAGYLHFAASDDLSLPVRVPKTPDLSLQTNGVLTGMSGMPKRNVKIDGDMYTKGLLEMCAGLGTHGPGTPKMLAEHRSQWKRARDCSKPASGVRKGCDEWQCSRPVAICEMPGGRPFPTNKQCHGKWKGYPVTATAWKFFERF